MTSLHLHHVSGCAPAPLAHYLKALGILRIVAEQRDPDIRGWWHDDHFCLLTKLDRPELETFFLGEYSPTPFLSPWNKGSGFFSLNDPGLHPLEFSTAPRFAAFRRGISAARIPLAALTDADLAVRRLKERTKARKGMTGSEKAAVNNLKQDPAFKAELAVANRHFSALKADLFHPCELSWRGPHREWMDSAVSLPDKGKPSFPSLLGTGGNDGRIDFTNNAMQRIGDLFEVAADGRPTPDADDLLKNTLWGSLSRSLVPAAVGQFLPGNAGGANATSGPDGNSTINPWDFILMLEGSLLFASRSTRRLDPIATSRASAPFAIRSHTAGHGSPGGEKADRGEQWMPIWHRPSSVTDIRVLLGEGRLQLGGGTAHRPIDVARAVARLGVARGVRRFSRFGFLERNGQSNLAVPLGRIDVLERPRARLVDDLAPWLDRLHRMARDKHAPARLVAGEHVLANAVFAALTHDDSPDRWQAVLLASAAIEAIQASGTAFKAGPIPPLSSDWLTASNDGTAEWRLARALGSTFALHDHGRYQDSIRHHWLPLENGCRRFREKEKRLVRDPRVVCGGRDLIADLGAVVERRLIEAAQRGQRLLPLIAVSGCEAQASDLGTFLAGGVDLGRLLGLSRAFMAIDWNAWIRTPKAATPNGAQPDEAWLALRLACLPWPLHDDRTVPSDDAQIRRLRAGDASGAVDLALRRLQAHGLRPPIQGASTDVATARVWAAALAFPISRRSAQEMARSFTVPNNNKR